MGLSMKNARFHPKYLNAIIWDAQKRMHRIPIKHTIDDYFIAVINNDEYAFKIDASRIGIGSDYEAFEKPFRVIEYTTEHYMPISQGHAKELELLIQKNSLPKVNRMLFNILSEIGKTEKNRKEGFHRSRKESYGLDDEDEIPKLEAPKTDGFQPYRLSELIEELKKREKAEGINERLRNIKTFLLDLRTEEIVTPVREITEFLQEDFIATDPRYLNSVPEAMIKAEIENKKITNTPMSKKRSWLKWAIVFGAIICVMGVVAWAFTSGTIQLPNLGGGFSFPSLSSGPNLQQLQSLYPTPESLKIAIDQGQVDPKTLPDFMRKAAEGAKLPTVTPQSHTINITP